MPTNPSSEASSGAFDEKEKKGEKGELLKAEKEKTEKLEKKKAENPNQSPEESSNSPDDATSEQGFYHSSARILDGKLARKTASVSRKQFLRQADAALVAQARPLPQSVLALLR